MNCKWPGNYIKIGSRFNRHDSHMLKLSELVWMKFHFSYNSLMICFHLKGTVSINSRQYYSFPFNHLDTKNVKSVELWFDILSFYKLLQRWFILKCRLWTHSYQNFNRTLICSSLPNTFHVVSITIEKLLKYELFRP